MPPTAGSMGVRLVPRSDEAFVAVVLVATTSFSLGVTVGANASLMSILYGAEIDNNTLFTIDLSTGQGATVRTPAGTQIEGLAFDPIAGGFLAVNNGVTALLQISLDPFGINTMHLLPESTYSNLARDPTTGNYYANRITSTNSLLRIDPVTMAIATVGPSVFLVQSLAFDANGRLFGIGRGTSTPTTLYEINTSN